METRARVHTKEEKKERKGAKTSLAQVELEITYLPWLQREKMVTLLSFLPLPTSHPFQKSLCARSRACSQHAHVHAGILPTSRRGLPPQPICCWKRFKYVNGRRFRHPINVIAFDIRHLHVWRRFPASDGTGATWALPAPWHVVHQKNSAKRPLAGMWFNLWRCCRERQFDGN